MLVQGNEVNDLKDQDKTADDVAAAIKADLEKAPNPNLYRFADAGDGDEGYEIGYCGYVDFSDLKGKEANAVAAAIKKDFKEFGQMCYIII